jgi:thiol-disulfide isomerase/thioredoxin
MEFVRLESPPYETPMRRFLAALLVSLLTACSGGSPPGGPVEITPDKPAVQAASDAPAAVMPQAPGPIALEIVDETGFARARDRHRGKVVLVDYWATWCQPCRELFPHTVRLHRELAGRGLVVLSVSVDDPEEQPAVREFLTRQQAAFENFISRYGAGSQSFEAFHIADGTVPCVQLYDRSGKMARQFSGASIDPAEIREAVQSLLGGE